MRFVKKVMNFLGLGTHEGHASTDNAGVAAADEGHWQEPAGDGYQGRRVGGGFSVKVPVVVERPHLGPVLMDCPQGDGGIQGLSWCHPKLRIDEDGDVANEFLEVDDPALSDGSGNPNTSAGFLGKGGSLALRGRVNEVVVVDGKVLHNTYVQGEVVWV